ncbi:MAG: radical SAM family heme chaperone HemW [Phycisphaerae bacterium]|nr:radical SAM family heme chaperone HemW [Phycisphaerae bacterium]
MNPSETDARPIGWYVHLPYCTTKCGYCDFYSLPTRPEKIPELVTAIQREADARDPHRPIRTVFIGGGTPTVLPAEALRAVLEPIRRRLGEPDAGAVEFTCEANPSSADELKLDLLRELGVNRLSLGAQSFNPDELRVLERIHDPAHITEAVRLARRAGFDNVNLDLIFAVPGQTRRSWLDSLNRAMDLAPEHIACYALTFEEGTALTKQKRMNLVRPCDEELEAELFESTIDHLTAAGYEHYEISNFARPGRRCRHNLIYWNNEEYLGLGPSAVSYLDGVRTKNIADVFRFTAAWLNGDDPGDRVVVEREFLDPPHRARETAFQMLRLIEGIRFDDFRRATGYDAPALFSEPIERNVRTGLLERRDGSVRLTRSGLLLANRVMQDFL